MFPFPKFNAVQSSVLETVSSLFHSLPDLDRLPLTQFSNFSFIFQVLNSDENVCVSAPTGSGKTVVFELAIIRLLMNSSTAKVSLL